MPERALQTLAENSAKQQRKTKTMSFTRKNNNRLERPATKYLEWKSTAESFRYWDKEIDEKDKNVNVDLRDGFIVLDNDLMSVTGYDEGREAGIFSNEVRTIHDHLDVRVFTKPKLTDLASGNYSEVKDAAKSAGGKYTRCVYALLDGEIVHIKLSGSGLPNWIEQIESKPSSMLQQHYVVMTGTSDEKKGSNKYKSPTWDFGDEISPSDFKAAEEADEKVQNFLDEYLNIDKETTEKSATTKSTRWQDHEVLGDKLGDLSIDELRAMAANYEEMEVYDNDYDKVIEAIEAQKGGGDLLVNKKAEQSHVDWRDFVTPKGKRLDECLLDELEKMQKFFSEHPSPKHANLTAAIDSGIAAMGGDDDSIPF